MTESAHPHRVFATPGELSVTVSEADAVLAAHLSATLHARLDWKQADACAADIVNMLSRKGWRVVRSAAPPECLTDSVPSIRAYAEGYEAGYQQSVKDNA